MTIFKPLLMGLALTFSICGASADEYHVNVLGVSDERAEEIEKIPALKKQGDENGLKIYGERKTQSQIPPIEDVQATLEQAKVDTSKMDQLDKDMFVMALRRWNVDKVVKRYAAKVPEEDIRRAWSMVRER